MRYRIANLQGDTLPFAPLATLGEAERLAKSIAVSSQAPIEVWSIPDETHAAVRISAFSPEAEPTFSLAEVFARMVHKRWYDEPVPARHGGTPQRAKPARVRRTVLRELSAGNDTSPQAAQA